MNARDYRKKRLLEIEAATDEPATYQDECLIEMEWEKIVENEREKAERKKEEGETWD